MGVKLAYKFYTVNSDGKIVCGFNTEGEAKEYAGKHRYKVFSRNNLHNKGVDSMNVENWSVALFDATSENKNSQTKE